MHHFGDHQRHVLGHARLHLVRPGDLGRPDVVQDFLMGRGAEGIASDDQFVEGHAKGVDIAAGVGVRAPPKLLRRHVMRGAEDDPLLGIDRVAILNVPRQPEVRKLGLARRGDQDIARFDVQVNHPEPAGVLQRPRHLQDDRARLFVGQTAAFLDHGRQTAAVHEFHGEIEAPRGLADVNRLDDVRMVQARRRARLFEEPRTEDPVVRVLRREDLERHHPVNAHLPRAKDRPHPPPRDLLLQTKAGNLLGNI